MGARHRRRAAIAFTLLPVLLLVSFHYHRFLRAELEPPGPSFGRPTELGVSDLSGSVATLPASGGDLLVFWSVRGGLDYFRVSPEGEVKEQGSLPLEVDTPTRSPTSLLATPGALFWLGGPALTDLWWAPLEPDVPSPGTPALLTTGVRAISLVPPPSPRTPDGQTEAPGAVASDGQGVAGAGTPDAWGARPSALLATCLDGLWWVPLGSDGHPQTPVRLTEAVVSLADAVPLADGRVAIVAAVPEEHGFLLQYRECDPRHLPPGPLPAITMGSYPLGEHELVRSLRCGQDGEQVYLFVTREMRDRGDLEVATAFAWWSAQQGPAGHTELKSLPLEKVADRTLIWLLSPEPAPGGRDPATGLLPVTFAALNRGPRGRDQDVLVAYFGGGHLRSAEFAALTRGAATQPRLTEVIGPNPVAHGYFLTWVDTAGRDRFRLRLTASLPAYRQAMARVRRADVVAATGETAMGLLLGYLPLLFALGWTLPALAVLVIAHAAALNWSERHPLTLGLLSLVPYLGAKGLVLGWVLPSEVLALRAPAWVGPGLALPLVAGTAGLAALLLLVSRQRATGLSWLGRFVLWDVVFTCLFLGPFFR